MDATPRTTRKRKTTVAADVVTTATTTVTVPLTADAWRTSNIGRLLNQSIQRFEESVLAKMAAAGIGEFTLSHVSVTRNLDVQGTRATELARRASITKQSLGELVTQLEKLGIVMREPDPTDGRAKIVRFTTQGMAWLEQFHLAVEQTEAEIEAELGATLFQALKKGLTKYAQPG